MSLICVITTTLSVSAQPEAVDLDLPSGTLWATMNVGANRPEDYGTLYAWGETKTKSKFEYNRYIFYRPSRVERDADGFETRHKWYYETVQNISDTEYDVAKYEWGNGWRMPTERELTELRTECTWDDVRKNGTNGYKVTGKNGNWIFIPLTYYDLWTGTSSSRSNFYAIALSLRWDLKFLDDEKYRGNYVRPVKSGIKKTLFFTNKSNVQFNRGNCWSRSGGSCEYRDDSGTFITNLLVVDNYNTATFKLKQNSNVEMHITQFDENKHIIPNSTVDFNHDTENGTTANIQQAKYIRIVFWVKGDALRIHPKNIPWEVTLKR